MTTTANSPSQEQPKPSYKGNWAVFDSKNEQHRNVLSRCRQLMWTVKSEKYGEVADLNRLDQWLRSDKCPVNKPLKKMEPKELTTIINALGQMLKKLYK